MKITKVTITGADDKVAPSALTDLVELFPFLEIGVLYSHERMGTPRFPSYQWIQKLGGMSFPFTTLNPVALHLCGDAAREAMAGDTERLPRVFDGWRLQLNGFSRFLLPGLAIARARPQLAVILQCSDQRAIGNALRLRAQYPNSDISALWDASGGRGVYQPDSWGEPPLGLRVGYAGGINEFNVEDAARYVNDMPGGDTWLDIETGARDSKDEFDLPKVRRILEAVKPLVTGGGP